MRGLALLLLACAVSPAGAQVAVVSPAPDRVGVTVYRDLDRRERRPDRNWLNGYALISETRTIRIPAGESELRFEGVASGIIPQSAIVAGVPDGLLERNRDALLLSAGSLLDRALGQRVSLQRTDPATGRVTRTEALVRTGSAGGVVFQTPDGFEALRCTGLKETPIYDRVPAGLSARPTLSVRVRARADLTATVTLSYLAGGFDWQADYVALLSPDERTLQLQAWLTLASTDDTSFVGATTQAVAGRVNRTATRVPPVEAPGIRLRCWPDGTTSDLPEDRPDTRGFALGARAGAPPPPPPPPPMAMAESIVVTGSRMTAQREALGDLKLYRIPEPVTVAANAQKQVGLLDQPAVRVQPTYLFRFVAGDESAEEQGRLVLRSRNRPAEGLGLPLPAGNVVVFRQGAGRPLLIGEGAMGDTAVGEKVEVAIAASSGVRARLASADKDRRSVTLTNDRPVSVTVEVELAIDEGQRVDGARIVRRDGKTLWEGTIPANGSVTLAYRLRR